MEQEVFTKSVNGLVSMMWKKSKALFVCPVLYLKAYLLVYVIFTGFS